MAKWKKTLARIMAAQSDYDIRLAEASPLLHRLGMESNQEGSHHTFRKEGWRKIVLQARDNGKIPPYQVDQIRKELKKHGY